MEYKTRYAFKISMDSNCSGRKAKENKVLEKGEEKIMTKIAR